MRKKILGWSLSLALGLLGWIPGANADSTEALCDVSENGEKSEKGSGACTFAEDQGVVGIKLRSGEIFELAPANRPGHFRDQNGDPVVRTAGADRHEYAWANRRIVVTFGKTTATPAPPTPARDPTG